MGRKVEIKSKFKLRVTDVVNEDSAISPLCCLEVGDVLSVVIVLCPSKISCLSDMYLSVLNTRTQSIHNCSYQLFNDELMSTCEFEQVDDE